MSRKLRKNVGLIGLGIIGTRVAAGLRTAGYQVYVWNRSARPVPNFLGSPAEIAESADIIQVFVADAAALFDVVEAMGDALNSNHVFVCNATVGPEAVMEAAKLVEDRGAQFLDAPFTGSKLAAEKRELVYYIGGSEAAFLKAKPILEASSKMIVHIGDVGHAATVKVATNMISAVTVQTLAEALAIVQKAGLPPEALVAAIEHNACRSGVIDMKLAKMISGNYEPHFSLKHMFKDVQLGIHMANALDIEIPATTVTAGVMFGALSEGWADLDFSALFKTYLRDNGREEMPALEQRKERAELPAPFSLPTPENEPVSPPIPDEGTAPAVPIIDAKPAEVPAENLAGDSFEAREIHPTHEASKIIEAMLAQARSALTEAKKESSEAKTDVLSEQESPGAASESSADAEKKSIEPESAVSAPQFTPLETVGVSPTSKTESFDAKAEPPGEQKSASAVSEILTDAEMKSEKQEPAPTFPKFPPLEPVASSSSNGPAAASEDQEPEVRPINYVRRWFVARMGG